MSAAVNHVSRTNREELAEYLIGPSQTPEKILEALFTGIMQELDQYASTDISTDLRQFEDPEINEMLAERRTQVGISNDLFELLSPKGEEILASSRP